jgi:hypothetical protein
MSHQIESEDVTFSTVGTEWHGLANVVESITEETISPLLFPFVEGTPSVTTEDGVTIAVDGFKTILADLRGREDLPQALRRYTPLHTPKESYRVITNREVWDCLQKAIQGLDGVKIITAGTLDHCKKFYLSLQLEDGKSLRTTKGDQFQFILNLLTSHDGQFNFTAMDSSIRTVCMNTLRANLAYEGGAMKVRIPHTKNAGIQIDNLGEYLQTVLAGREKVISSMSYLEGLKMESPSQAAYAAAGFLTAPDALECSTQTFNRASVIRDLSVTGKGNNGKTRADMLNGFTDFFTNGEGAGGRKADKAKRWSVSQFGNAAVHKDGFFSLLMDEDSFSETLARGEKLFRDKEQLMLA